MFPFHLAQIFPTTSVAFLIFQGSASELRVSSLSLKRKGSRNELLDLLRWGEGSGGFTVAQRAGKEESSGTVCCQATAFRPCRVKKSDSS